MFFASQTLWTLAALLSLATSPSSSQQQDGAYLLPSLSKSISFDETYRLTFQLQMLESKELLMLEEFADFKRKLFRLDLIAGNTRTSYLTRGVTGEIFRYRPYTCELLAADSPELDVVGRLFKGHSLTTGADTDGPRAYGLGPLWMRVHEEAKTVHLVKPLGGSNGGTYAAPGAYLSAFFDTYEISLGGETSALRMHFVPTHAKSDLSADKRDSFVDTIVWLDPRGINVEARAKVVALELGRQPDRLFELPAGYGCRRRPDLDHPLRVDVGGELLRPTGASRALLELTASQPDNELLHKWQSESYSVRLTQGSLGDRTYFASLLQQVDPTSGLVKRTRRVWAAPDAPADGSSPSPTLVYTMDPSSGSCRVTREQRTEHMRLAFPSIGGAQQAAGKQELALGVDFISSLFSDGTDFHLIHEQVNLKSSDVADATYEKRVASFTLNSDGQQVWRGPASVVKRVASQFSLEEQEILSNARQPPRLLRTYHSKISLILYSDDLTQIVYKIVIELIDNNEVETRYLHRQLDISSCLASDQTESILVKYPLESAGLGKRLRTVKDILEELISVNLFVTTPIQLLQVANVRLSFDSFFMYLRMSLLELPLSHTYALSTNKRLASDDANVLVQQFAASADRCASACADYDCKRFSYSPVSRHCRIELLAGAAELVDSVAEQLFSQRTARLSSYSGAWTALADQGSARAHLRPQLVVALLQQIVERSPEDADVEPPDSKQAGLASRPLDLLVPGELLADKQTAQAGDPPTWIRLRPLSVHSDLDELSELVRTANPASQLEGLRVQYNILLAEHTYGTKASMLRNIHLSDHSYEQCALACENADCRSFSYCQSKRLCLISRLHSSEEIAKASEPDHRCNIHSLDYLTKFERLGRTLRPSTSVRKEVLAADGKGRARDCANLCMEEPEFTCQGFHFCPTGCLLYAGHINETPEELQRAGLALVYNRQSSSSPSDLCEFYSRSHLAHFDEFLGKTVAFADSQLASRSSRALYGLSTEGCARECIRDKCLAFDLCQYNGNSPKTSRSVCNLVSANLNQARLEPSAACNTFVLADKSQYRLSVQDRPAGSDKPDRAASLTPNPDQPKQEAIAAATGQLSGASLDLLEELDGDQLAAASASTGRRRWFLSLFLGLLLGVLCGCLWIQRDALYRLASRLPVGRPTR